MIFKSSFLAIVLLLCNRPDFAVSAPIDQTVTELLSQLLESISRSDSKFAKRDNWQLSEPMISAAGQDIARIKPLAAPPPAPALGAVDMPVAWPYPPAPKSADNSEFPLLDRFLKNSGISSNVQNNQINTNSLHQNSWSEQQKPSSPTQAPIQWGFQDSKQTQPQPQSPQYMEWGVPQKAQEWKEPQKPKELGVPLKIQEWGGPQKTLEWREPQKTQEWREPQKAQEWVVPQAQFSGPLTPSSAHPSLLSSPISPVSAQPLPPQQLLSQPLPPQQLPPQQLLSQPLPPPLNPNDNFYIQHNRQSQGQPKHFSLDTIRMSDNQNENPADKLNVSFIMPPNMRPLSLNFDTGEVQIDFGDGKGKNFKVETIPSSAYNEKIPNMSAIFKPDGTGKATTQEDDEYIVVRHDMNKYTYDLPKGMSFASNPLQQQQQQQQQLPPQQQLLPQLPPQQDVGTGSKQTSTVEKFDVSGKKNLHFVLGRVSV